MSKVLDVQQMGISSVVDIPFSAVDGVYIPLEQPIWQFAIRFCLPRLGTLAIMGTIDVDAIIGTPLVLSEKRIRTIQERADAFYCRISYTNNNSMNLIAYLPVLR